MTLRNVAGLTPLEMGSAPTRTEKSEINLTP